ncbi:hypothetical protein HKD37_20G056826 [Glycine soja]
METIDRKWMSTSRLSKEYGDGVKEFIRFGVESLLEAVNAYEMEEHLMYNGIDQSYTCWTRYGEKRNETADYEMHGRVRNTAPTKVDNDKNTDPKAQALKTAMAVKSGGQVFKKKAKQTRTLL